MKTKIITIEEKEYIITAVPLVKYPEMLRKLNVLPKKLDEFSGLDNESIFIKLPGILAEAMDEVIAIIQFGTNLSDDVIQIISAKDTLTILLAIWEVNDYQELYAQVKKVFARPTTTEPARILETSPQTQK